MRISPIRKMILKGNDKASISKVDIERFPNWSMSPFTLPNPALSIGRKGAQVKVLRTDLEQLCGTKVKVDVNENHRADLDAKLVADNIASQLERRISHSRANEAGRQQALPRRGQRHQNHVRRSFENGSEMARANGSAKAACLCNPARRHRLSPRAKPSPPMVALG